MMDTDTSQSDLSRLTTMLTAAGVPFARGAGAGAMRFIEVYGVAFEFTPEGALKDVLPPEEDE